MGLGCRPGTDVGSVVRRVWDRLFAECEGFCHCHHLSKRGGPGPLHRQGERVLRNQTAVIDAHWEPAPL